MNSNITWSGASTLFIVPGVRVLHQPPGEYNGGHTSANSNFSPILFKTNTVMLCSCGLCFLIVLQLSPGCGVGTFCFASRLFLMLMEITRLLNQRFLLDRPKLRSCCYIDLGCITPTAP